MSFIYLAQPYYSPNEEIREARFRIAEFMTAYYTQNREVVYAPIVHFHEISKGYYLPKDASFWRDNNFAMLERAHYLRILEMPGWEKSEGLRAEIDFFVDRSPFVPIQSVSWRSIITLASKNQDEEGTPLLKYIELLRNAK